jgi:hypothetical protein
LINRGAILVNTFSRAESLKKCLESIQKANKDFSFPVFIVLQNGYPEVKEVLKAQEHAIKKIVEVEGGNRTPLENINWNRYLGYEILFDDEKFDWVIAIEEDVAIAPDALKFATQIVDRYSQDPSFKGINFGSREPFNLKNSNTYSLLRYGLHGQASLLPKSSWNKFPHKRMKRKFSTHGFDSLIEFNLKMGFMVTPNLSRSLDMGWDGTHVPSDSSDPYFVEMAASYVGDRIPNFEAYELHSINHQWRSDIRIYRRNETLSFIIQTKYYLMKHFIKKLLLKTLKS